jgi:amino acid adenylation domain-containing protein
MSSTPNSEAHIIEDTKSATQNRSAPLTFAQESLYFINQLTGELPVYHMPMAFRLMGDLDLDSLTHALNLIVERHGALRTKIIESDSGPVQEIVPANEIAIEFYDLTQIPQLEINNLLPAKLLESASKPFNLAAAPGFRVALFRISATEHVLLFVLHHILGDMSSLSILIEELSFCYNALVADKPVPFESVPAQFLDYALQESNLDNSESLKFWHDHLEGCSDELEFPLDYSRPASASFSGALERFEIAPDLAAKIKTLARKNRSSVYMVLLAALQVLIYRFTSQRNFTVATPFSNRLDPALEKTIGYLVNLLPMPCRINPELSLSSHIQNVRDFCLEALGHSKVSFREILKSIGVPSHEAKPPLSRIVFQYFPASTTELTLEGLKTEPLALHTGTSKFDLCLTLIDNGEELLGELEYDTALFRHSSIETFINRFKTILERIAADPDALIQDTDIMLPRERDKILSWSGIKTDFPRTDSVYSLFHKQVLSAPDAIALKFQKQCITYSELETRVDQIARSLLEHGVTLGTFVGVSMKRSPELIAVLLAILKTGGAYVPIDPDYPVDRVRQILDQANLRLVICDHEFQQPGGLQLQILHSNDLRSENGQNVAIQEIPADSPAYVMFTSGSTGVAKGVVVPHRAIIRLVKNTNFANFSSDQTFLAFAPVTFDASTLEIWGPLLNGGTLAIYPPSFDSIEQLESVIQENQVTTLWLTAGLFNTLVDKNPLALRSVQQLLIGGDVLSPEHVRKAMAALPNTRFINGYGPTENTTFTCCYTIPREFEENTSIPIGTPIANTTVYILDEQLRPVPAGVPGTLYTGGAGLSLGYLNDSELTRTKFIPNPITGNSELIYNTGDRARWLEDGRIEFLGRLDNQVKIRGFRIELGEVEVALRKLPEIKDACAIVHTSQDKAKSLVAYVVTANPQTFNDQTIFSSLSKVLPSHLCPTRLIPVSTLPLTANGKVDRKRLASTVPDHSDSKANIEPADAVESRIAEIWRQLLQVKSLSMTDNLFHIGGDSLLATRAISQINRAFRSKVTLAKLFQNPTVRGLSALVNQSPVSSETDSQSADSTEIEINELSDSEVDSLLNQLLTE